MSHDKHQQPIDVLESGYISYFLRHNMFPNDSVFIPVVNQTSLVQLMLNKVRPDFIVFTGGNNVKPTDKTLAEKVGDFCEARDIVETLLAQYADSNNIPKLAICRGCQFLNVYYGGSLTYYLSEHSIGKHIVRWDNAECSVNSYHQHGIEAANLASLFEPIVMSDDNRIVEAYRNRSKDISPTLGIQWHPERDDIIPDLFLKIGKPFINESCHPGRR